MNTRQIGKCESRRALALTWWRDLSDDKKKELATKYYSHMPFIAVDKSSSYIEEICMKENVY